MTDNEKAAIAEHRRKGCGYKKISHLTGVCESTVKTFCRRNGLAGIAAESESPRTAEQPCKYCGKAVVQYPGRKEKKFCSDACRNKWWNSHLGLVKRKAMYEFVCPRCKKTFYAYGNKNRKYCSHECYIEDRFGGGVCE